MKDEDLTEVEAEEKQFEQDKKDGFYQSDANPESQADSNRKSGLAYGAVITLVGAILVFLAIGWAFDRYFQTAPWALSSELFLAQLSAFTNLFAFHPNCSLKINAIFVRHSERFFIIPNTSLQNY